MVNKELQEFVSFKTFSEFERKSLITKTPWLGDLYVMPI